MSATGATRRNIAVLQLEATLQQCTCVACHPRPSRWCSWRQCMVQQCTCVMPGPRQHCCACCTSATVHLCHARPSFLFVRLPCKLSFIDLFIQQDKFGGFQIEDLVINNHEVVIRESRQPSVRMDTVPGIVIPVL